MVFYLGKKKRIKWGLTHSRGFIQSLRGRCEGEGALILYPLAFRRNKKGAY